MKPIPMILYCPACGEQHIDKAEEPRRLANGNVAHGCEMCDGEDECTCPGWKPRWWTNPPHRSHLCDNCGHIWRPADVPTEGVASIATVGEKDHPPRAPLKRPNLEGGVWSKETVEAALDRAASVRTLIMGTTFYAGWIPSRHSEAMVVLADELESIRAAMK